MAFNIFKKKSDKGTVVIEVASTIIQMQLNLGRCNLSSLSSTKDNFALGYIFGIHDALLQGFDIPSNAEGLAVLAVSFTNLAESEDDGGRILRQCFDLQTDKQFKRGVVEGGNDAVAFCRNKTPPLGLSTHLCS